MAEALRRLVARVAPRADLAEADLAFAGWVDARTGRAAELPSGGGIYAFCGLANPDTFRRSLEALGRRLAGWTVFRDHHAYGERDLADLARRAASSGAVAAVTTAKDAVRIPAWPGPLPLYRAEVKLVMIQGRERLWNDLEILAAGGRA